MKIEGIVTAMISEYPFTPIFSLKLMSLVQALLPIL